MSCSESQWWGLIFLTRILPPLCWRVLQDQAECVSTSSLTAAVSCDCPNPAVRAPHNVHTCVNHMLLGNMKHGSADARSLPAALQSQASTARSRMTMQAPFASTIHTPPQHRHFCFVPQSPQSMRDVHRLTMCFGSYIACHSTTKIIHTTHATISQNQFSLKRLLFHRQVATVQTYHCTMHMSTSTM